jgi:putative restriction endonuclease
MGGAMTTYELPAWHVQALEWFEANAGREFAQRPFDVGLAIKVTSLQRGIWKPSATQYAVSVLQTHKGIYEDQDPVYYDDATWRYFYHQEGKAAEDLADPERLYANAGLFKCMRDGIPVGVIIPAESGRGYEVLGLALIESYSSGYFGLVGPVSVGAVGTLPLGAEASAQVSVSLVDLPLGDFDPNAQEDTRLKVLAAVHRRQGGVRFRRALLGAYRSSCAMTGYDAPPALEAAHIVPYRGQQTNHVANGLLLRADMHDLFDLGLVAVDVDSMSLLLAKDLEGTQYEQYAGRQLWVPPEAELRPNAEALDKHRLHSAVA